MVSRETNLEQLFKDVFTGDPLRVSGFQESWYKDFQKSLYEDFQRSLYKLIKTNSAEIKDAVTCLSLLPALTLSEVRSVCLLEPPTPDEKNLIDRICFGYFCKSVWFDAIRNGKNRPDGLPCEKSARISNDVFDLIGEIHSKFLKQWGTPMSIWFAWERENCERVLWDSGLFTKKGETLDSKDRFVRDTTSLINFLESNDIELPKGFAKQIQAAKDLDVENITIENVLFSTFRKAARDDSQFRHSKAFRSFNLNLKSTAWHIRNNPELSSFPMLENGKFLVDGRKSRRTANKGKEL